MSGMAAHHRHEEPLAGRGGVLHQIPDELHAQVHRRCEAEGGDLRRKRQVVVDGLGDVDDRHAAVDGAGDLGGAEGGVVTADGEEIGDVELAQRFDDVLEGLRRPGGIGAGGTQDGAALEMDLGRPQRCPARARGRGPLA